MSKTVTECFEVKFIDFLEFFSFLILLLMIFLSYFVNKPIVSINFLFISKSVLIVTDTLGTFTDDKIGKFCFVYVGWLNKYLVDILKSDVLSFGIGYIFNKFDQISHTDKTINDLLRVLLILNIFDRIILWRVWFLIWMWIWFMVLSFIVCRILLILGWLFSEIREGIMIRGFVIFDFFQTLIFWLSIVFLIYLDTFAEIAVTPGMVILFVFRRGEFIRNVDVVFLFDILNVLLDMFLKWDNDFFVLIFIWLVILSWVLILWDFFKPLFHDLWEDSLKMKVYIFIKQISPYFLLKWYYFIGYFWYFIYQSDISLLNF